MFSKLFEKHAKMKVEQNIVISTFVPYWDLQVAIFLSMVISIASNK